MTAVAIAVNPRLEAALGYAERGWWVLPLHAPNGVMGCSCDWDKCRNPGKHPLVKHGLDDASRDQATLRRWWSRYPFANVGVRTGVVSGLIVLDVDPRHGGDDALADLLAKHGPLPATVEAITGSGGRHIFFSHPGTPVQNRIGSIGSGLDLKADGGYVVAAPSRHVSGNVYAWELSAHPDDQPLASPPMWLLHEPRVPGTKAGRSPSEWRELIAKGAVEGERNARVASVAGHLLARRVDPMVVLDLLLCWNAARSKPPLPDDEVISTVNSIAKRERLRRAGGNDHG